MAQNISQKNILIIGSGGREHALVKGLKKSANCANLYALPGNAGINKDAIGVENIKPTEFEKIAEFCTQKQIAFVVVGPEQPLVDGIVDFLESKNIKVFGPNKFAAQLEGSKDFMKHIVSKYNIPTAEYKSFTDANLAKEYITQKGAPIVVKTDGLAAGKGVTVAMNLADALQAVDEAFAGKFGSAGQKLVIEEFLDGEEASFFAICDGKKAVYFGSAQDHKRAFDGDKGPNTGGMGTYSPAPIVTDALIEKTMQTIINPTMEAFKAEGIVYKGFLFAGLMIDKSGTPKLIEYNIRMGDPETQSIIPRLKSDLVEIFENAIDGKLNASPEFENNHALCVVYAAKGYPEDYPKDLPIDLSGVDLNDAENPDKNNSQTIIYHAGTKLDANAKLVSNGGRVLGVTGLGADLKTAQKNAYNACEKIKFDGGFYRKDIGWRAL
jgi:phosphoribosylamine--glycine ligase